MKNRNQENYRQYMRNYMLAKREKERIQELKGRIKDLESHFKKFRAIFKNIRKMNYSEEHKKKWSKQVERRETLLEVKPLINKMNKIFKKIKIAV